jgi:hypothetical protein
MVSVTGIDSGLEGKLVELIVIVPVYTFGARLPGTTCTDTCCGVVETPLVTLVAAESQALPVLLAAAENVSGVPFGELSIVIDAFCVCPPCADVKAPNPSGMLMVNTGAEAISAETGMLSVDGLAPPAG